MENNINTNLNDNTKSFQERVDEIRGLAEENLNYTKAIYSGRAEAINKEETDIKQLLQENLSVSHEIYRVVKKINRQLLWQKIWGGLKFIIIIVPLIAGTIYFYPLLGQMVETYQNISNIAKGELNLNINSNNLKIDPKKVNADSVQNILNQIKK